MSRPLALQRFVRFVLAWFVLAVGVAVAAPLVQPSGWQLVCGGGTVKLLPQDEQDATGTQLTLDCALCAPAVVPPPARTTHDWQRLPAAVPQESVAPGLVASVALPPAARGPPKELRT